LSTSQQPTTLFGLTRNLLQLLPDRHMVRMIMEVVIATSPIPPETAKEAGYDTSRMLASYTSGQPSNPRRHSTCFASSQWSHTVSSMPCHKAWTSAPLSAHPSIECKRTAPQIETPICTRRTTTHLISLSDNNSIRAAQWADQQWNAE